MKLTVISGFLFVVLLTGCSSSNTSTSKSASPTSSISEQPKDTSMTGPSTVFPGDSTQLQPSVTSSGLQYIDMVVGTGASPKKGDKVTVHYTGYLLNGRKFDSSVDRGQPLSFTIGVRQVISGWDEGIASMKVGGKRKLIIPAELGYGEAGAGSVIPPNAQLIFDVQLIDTK